MGQKLTTPAIEVLPIQFVGLDNSGKSSILSNLTDIVAKEAANPESEYVCTAPTVGLNLLDFSKFSYRWRVWDMSGQGRYRYLWPYYFGHVKAIVFVVDVTDVERIAVVRDELQALLAHPIIKQRHPPILIMANKMDLEDSPEEGVVVMGVDTLEQALSLEIYKQARFRIRVQATSGLAGSGIDEGLKWIIEVA